MKISRSLDEEATNNALFLGELIDEVRLGCWISGIVQRFVKVCYTEKANESNSAEASCQLRILLT